MYDFSMEDTVTFNIQSVVEKIDDIIQSAYASYSKAEEYKGQIRKKDIDRYEKIMIVIIVILIILISAMLFDVSFADRSAVYASMVFILTLAMIFTTYRFDTVTRYNRQITAQMHAYYADGDSILMNAENILDLIPYTYWFPIATSFLVHAVTDGKCTTMKMALCECRTYILECREKSDMTVVLSKQKAVLEHIKDQSWFTKIYR